MAGSVTPACGAFEPQMTARVRRHYDRSASLYDVFMAPIEIAARTWRRDQWRAVGRAERILEVGVGTGRSIPIYPAGAWVTAIDVSPRMLDRARQRAERIGARVDLRVADVQQLPFADASFDAVVSTFVFCCVPDPEVGLREIRRVLRPCGRVSMVEHVLSRRCCLGTIMRVLDRATTSRWGEHLARDTAEEVRRAGFSRIESRDLALDVFKAIHAER